MAILCPFSKGTEPPAHLAGVTIGLIEEEQLGGILRQDIQDTQCCQGGAHHGHNPCEIFGYVSRNIREAESLHYRPSYLDERMPIALGRCRALDTLTG